MRTKVCGSEYLYVQSVWGLEAPGNSEEPQEERQLFAVCAFPLVQFNCYFFKTIHVDTLESQIVPRGL